MEYTSDGNHKNPSGVREPQTVYTNKKQGEFTIDDYRVFSEDKRYELIDGFLIEMHAPSSAHQSIAASLYTAIADFIRGSHKPCRAWFAPIDVQLDCDEHTMLQPDILIVCDSSKIRRFGIYGAPDFIAEILSPSTRLRDLTVKAGKYAQAGVREYWIIDPEKEVLITYNFMDRDYIPVIHSLKGKVSPEIYDGELQIDLTPISEIIREFKEELAD